MIQRIYVTLFISFFALNLNALTFQEKEKITNDFLKDADHDVKKHLKNMILDSQQIDFGFNSDINSYKKYIKHHIDQIHTLSWLQKLSLRNTNISDVPNQLSTLTELTELNLSNNKIETLPADFINLTKLKTLHLDHNAFKEVPECLKHLELNILYMDHNKITILPTWLAQINKITLSFEDNPIKIIPKEFKSWFLISWISDYDCNSDRTLKLTRYNLNEIGEGENIGQVEFDSIRDKYKNKKLKEEKKSKFSKLLTYKENITQHPHINIEALSKFYLSNLPEAILNPAQMIHIVNSIFEGTNFTQHYERFYIDFYESTGLLPDEHDPKTNQKRFEKIVFPLITKFVATIWDLPTLKNKNLPLTLVENKSFLKKAFSYIFIKLTYDDNADLIFPFTHQLIQAAVKPSKCLELIYPTLLELQQRDLKFIEDIEDKLRQFIAYKKALCFDLILLPINETHQIPNKIFYRTILNTDLGLPYIKEMTHKRPTKPINDSFECDPWKVFDSFFKKFTPHYLIECLIEHTKKIEEEDTLFTVEQIAQYLKHKTTTTESESESKSKHDYWSDFISLTERNSFSNNNKITTNNKNNETDKTYFEEWSSYFTENPFTTGNQSNLKEKGAQKVLELLGVISTE